MEQLKGRLGSMFADANGYESSVLPKAGSSSESYAAWLAREVSTVPSMLECAADFWACEGALTVASALELEGCDHLKKLGRPSHCFPDVDDVREAKPVYHVRNVAARFFTKFWTEGGGRVLVVEAAKDARRKVCLCL